LPSNGQFCPPCGLCVERTGKPRALWRIANGNGTWRITVEERDLPEGVVTSCAKGVAVAGSLAVTFLGGKIRSKGRTKGSDDKSSWGKGGASAAVPWPSARTLCERT
jgi:hypothetical protein